MKTYQKSDLKKFNVANLSKIATEEFNFTPAENLSKGQIVTAIMDIVEGRTPMPQAASATPAPAKTTTPAEPAKAEKKEIGNVVDISEVSVGSVIRYLSSKKLYLVAEITKNGDKVAKLLYSATQRYYSTKIKFNVVEVIKGNGELTEAIAAQFDELVKAEFKTSKNVEYNKLYAEVKNELQAIAAKAAAKAKKAETPKTETPAPAPEATGEAENATKPLSKEEAAKVKLLARQQKTAKDNAAKKQAEENSLIADLQEGNLV